MATTSIVRSLEAGQVFPRSEEIFLAASAIVVGDALALDYDAATDAEIALYVLPLDSADASAIDFVGVALSAGAAGDKIRVCIAGICEAKVSTSTAKGDHLVAGSTGGELAVFAGTETTAPLAVAVEADTAGVATIRVFRTF